MAKDDKPPVVSATDVKQADKRDAGAYERGAKAGQQKNPEDGNPYPEGSSGAKSFEHGQLDAKSQKQRQTAGKIGAFVRCVRYLHRIGISLPVLI